MLINSLPVIKINPLAIHPKLISFFPTYQIVAIFMAVLTLAKKAIVIMSKN